jgi:hypothetical protein
MMDETRPADDGRQTPRMPANCPGTRKRIREALATPGRPGVRVIAKTVWSRSRDSASSGTWPAPGSEDTELGVLMELEVGHGETEVYARVQA